MLYIHIMMLKMTPPKLCTGPGDRGYLNYVQDNRLRKTETIRLWDVENTIRLEYPTCERRFSVQLCGNALLLSS